MKTKGPYVHYFPLGYERLSLYKRIRWFVLRHWWWIRGWSSRDGRSILFKYYDA